MKKMLFFIGLLMIGKVYALDLTTYSKSAIMIEPTTNTVLYELNKDERLAPASMTKLMTMLIIMESIDNAKISLDDDVLISTNASSMGGSQVFLEANSKLKVEQLLKGIAIASGNDAAVAMAEHIAGSTDEFVNMMNNKVTDLGLKNTHFVNVHGLDADNHYSSAYDMSIIAKELLKHGYIKLNKQTATLYGLPFYKAGIKLNETITNIDFYNNIINIHGNYNINPTDIEGFNLQIKNKSRI